MGINTSKDLMISNILEADSVQNATKSFEVAGVQCVLSNTRDMLPAILAQQKLDNRLEEMASSALKITNSVKPQHTIVELGNCGLPLDDMSKNSLVEFKDQYVKAARVFEKISKHPKYIFDAYMLTGLNSISKIKCALMGLRQVSDKTIFVNSMLNADGRLNSNEDVYDYAQVLSEFGATVAGFCIEDNVDTAVKLTKRLRAGCSLPILVDFCYNGKNNSPYANCESMKEACIKANLAGAQFLRASGFARPAYAAILVAMSTKMPLKSKIGI